MTDSITFDLKGFDVVAAKMKLASKELRYKGGRAALRKATQIVATQLRQNARAIDDPDTGRSIARNVAMRWNGRLFKQSKDIGFRVGIRHGAVLKDKGADVPGAPTPYWRLVQFGTEKMRANPFATRALTENVQSVIDKFAQEFEKELDGALK